MGRGVPRRQTSMTPSRWPEIVRQTVAERTGFTCCVGIGDNKVRAKMATGFAKAPAGALPEDAPGVFRLTKANWLDVMGDRPTDALWGVGAKTSAKLTELGITTVRELAAADLDVMRSPIRPAHWAVVRLVRTRDRRSDRDEQAVGAQRAQPRSHPRTRRCRTRRYRGGPASDRCSMSWPTLRRLARASLTLASRCGSCRSSPRRGSQAA